ncbi:SDR family NAD(P)-dependent oxidoreductase [Paracoccus sp. (in: a-proteobacteria)]|uniref:SDR family NAD(P)-dependent oxidoreductase n=1 Tax=Paracoccus sp. TaxID=267 RepID=UPI003A89BAEE
MSVATATVLITGGAAGIGLAIAHAATRRGARALIWDINAARLDRAAAELPGCKTLCADISDPDAVIDAFARGPAPTHLVNNAGILGPDMALNAADADAIDRVLAVNLRGAMLVTSGFLNARTEHPTASIVNMSSIAGFNGGARGRAVYGATKGAMLALTQAMARDLAPALRVNALAPGIIDTEIQAGLFAGRAALEAATASIPAARLGQPSEVASAAEWLLFDAAYVTGEVIRVAGGRK